MDRNSRGVGVQPALISVLAFDKPERERERERERESMPLHLFIITRHCLFIEIGTGELALSFPYWNMIVIGISEIFTTHIVNSNLIWVKGFHPRSASRFIKFLGMPSGNPHSRHLSYLHSALMAGNTYVKRSGGNLRLLDRENCIFPIRGID